MSQTLYIKNMVCDRCKMAVKQILEQAELHPLAVELGVVTIEEDSLSDEKRLQLAQALKSIGFEKIDLEPEIHVQNIVASADLKTDLNLNAIALGLGLENIEYEPEQFPGLVYRIKQPKVVVLIFSSGKLVVTGGKSPEECEEGVHIVRMQLENMGLL